MSDENLDLGQSRGPDDLFGDLGKKNSPLTSPGFAAPSIDLDVDSPTMGRRILTVMASPALLFGSIALAIVGLIAGFIPSSWSTTGKMDAGTKFFPVTVVVVTTGANLLKNECRETPLFKDIQKDLVTIESRRNGYKRIKPLGFGIVKGNECIFEVAFEDATSREGTDFNVTVGIGGGYKSPGPIRFDPNREINIVPIELD